MIERALARLEAMTREVEARARQIKDHLELGVTAPLPRTAPECCGRTMQQCQTHYAWTCLGCGRMLGERTRFATIELVER